MNIKRIIEILLETNTVIIAFFGVSIFQIVKITTNKLISSQQESKKEMEAIKKGNITILHSLIYKECKKYINDGTISIQDYDDLTYLYKAYKNLGGNGVAEKMYNKITDLLEKEVEE